MNCERIQNLMVEALYGELDAGFGADFDAHLASCPACAALFEEMRATASLMGRRRAPDPGDEYWASYYERLRERMDAAPAVLDETRVTARRRTYVSWGYRVAAAVAVLTAGVWLGRSTLGPDASRRASPEVAAPATPAPGDRTGVADSARGGEELAASSSRGTDTTAAGAERPTSPAIDAASGAEQRRAGADGDGSGVVLVSAGDRARNYVERSQVLLLALVNAEPEGGGEGTRIGEQRERAGELVREAAVLRDELGGDDDRRLRELVGQLQMILREIANLEAENDLDAVELIRNRVSREGVLLKINMEQMRESAGTPARSGQQDPID